MECNLKLISIFPVLLFKLYKNMKPHTYIILLIDYRYIFRCEFHVITLGTCVLCRLLKITQIPISRFNGNVFRWKKILFLNCIQLNLSTIDCFHLTNCILHRKKNCKNCTIHWTALWSFPMMKNWYISQYWINRNRFVGCYLSFKKKLLSHRQTKKRWTER